MAVQFTKNSPGALLASLISKNKPGCCFTGPRTGKTHWCMDGRRAHARGSTYVGCFHPFLNDKKVGIGPGFANGEQHRLPIAKVMKTAISNTGLANGGGNHGKLRS
jgi:hypothetical protein